MLNRQEIFTRGVQGIRAQGKLAVQELCGRMVCKYRTDFTGLACIIGQNIPDQYYNPIFEGLSIRDLLRSNIDAVCKLKENIFPGLNLIEDSEFLLDLQRCHDAVSRCAKTEIEQMKEFEINVKCFARKYHLTIPPQEGSNEERT